METGDAMLTDQCMKTRIGTQRVEVRIFGRPILVERSEARCLLQTLNGFLSLAKNGEDASHIVKDRGFFRVNRERSLRPIQASCAIPHARKKSRPEIERPGVIRMNFGVPLYRLQ